MDVKFCSEGPHRNDVSIWNKARYHRAGPDMSVIEFVYSFLYTLLQHFASYNLTHISAKDAILTHARDKLQAGQCG